MSSRTFPTDIAFWDTLWRGIPNATKYRKQTLVRRDKPTIRERFKCAVQSGNQLHVAHAPPEGTISSRCPYRAPFFVLRGHAVCLATNLGSARIRWAVVEKFSSFGLVFGYPPRRITERVNPMVKTGHINVRVNGNTRCFILLFLLNITIITRYSYYYSTPRSLMDVAITVQMFLLPLNVAITIQYYDHYSISIFLVDTTQCCHQYHYYSILLSLLNINITTQCCCHSSMLFVLHVNSLIHVSFDTQWCYHYSVLLLPLNIAITT